MRNGILIVSLGFAITLAILIGNRLSNEAMAVLTGALCGISATLPVSLALFIAANRNWGRNEAEHITHPPGYSPTVPMQQPQIIVVSPSQMPNQAYGFQSPQLYLPPTINSNFNSPREFKIVGEE